MSFFCWQDLIEDLNSELSKNLKTLVLALFEPRAIYDAHCLRKAMKGLGTDEAELIEILCTRTNQVSIIMSKVNSHRSSMCVFMQEIKDIVAAYKSGKLFSAMNTTMQ